MGAVYDKIGGNYADLRKPDARIEAQIHEALGSANTILNVGAGTGSYEPTDRVVTALEPSAEMIAQRKPEAAPAIQGVAEDLPFEDKAFDASMAILTIHHWTDKPKGLSEMRRVTRDQVLVLTFDPAHLDFWLTDYFPELVTLDEGKMPRMSELEAWLGPLETSVVPIPHDCTDGLLCAYWRRPEAYLDPVIRSGMSPFWAMKNTADGLAQLESDLERGVWAEKYAHLLDLVERDFGYRLLMAKA